jgi:hypothetical protein
MPSSRLASEVHMGGGGGVDENSHVDIPSDRNDDEPKIVFWGTTVILFFLSPLSFSCGKWLNKSTTTGLAGREHVGLQDFPY